LLENLTSEDMDLLAEIESERGRPNTDKEKSQ